MSRETKIGMMVAAGFLMLVGGVLAYKLYSGDGFAQEQNAQAGNASPEEGKDQQPAGNGDNGGKPAREREQVANNEGGTHKAEPPSEPPATDQVQPVAQKQQPPDGPPPTEQTTAEHATQHEQVATRNTHTMPPSRPMPPTADEPPATEQTHQSPPMPPTRPPHPPAEPPATDQQHQGPPMPPSRAQPPTEATEEPAKEPPATEKITTRNDGNRPMPSDNVLPGGPPKPASEPPEPARPTKDTPPQTGETGVSEPPKTENVKSTVPPPPEVPSLPKESSLRSATPTEKPKTPRLEVPMNDDVPQPSRTEPLTKDVPPPPPSNTYDKTYTPKLGRPVPDATPGQPVAKNGGQASGIPLTVRPQPDVQDRPVAKTRDGIPVVLQNQSHANVDSFDVEVYQFKTGDSYAAISKFRYRNERYQHALARFNKERNAQLENPQVGMSIYLPPVAYLERKYGNLIPGLPSDNVVPATGDGIGTRVEKPASARTGSTSTPPVQADWRPVRKQQ